MFSLTPEQAALEHSGDPELVWVAPAPVPFGADDAARAAAVERATAVMREQVEAAGREVVGPAHAYPFSDARASGEDLEVATVICLTRPKS